MGYTTEFKGKVVFDQELPKTLIEFLERLCTTRRMARNPEKIKEIYKNWQAMCYNGNLGTDGEFFAVDEKDEDYKKNMKYLHDSFGQAHDDSIIDYNNPPRTQPGLWCQWAVVPVNKDDMEDDTKDTVRAYLEWDGGEKFYSYVEWLRYIISNFIEPLDITACGAFLAVGEEYGDASYIIVDNNEVSVKDAFHEGASEEVFENLSGELLKYFEKEIAMEPDDIQDEYWDWYEEDEEYDDEE